MKTTVKMIVDSTEHNGIGSMIIGVFFNQSQNVGKVTHTYRHGNAVLSVREDGTRTSISITEAEEIDPIVAEICRRQNAKIPVTIDQQHHAMSYFIQHVKDILAIVNKNRLEREFSPENLELEFA